MEETKNIKNENEKVRTIAVLSYLIFFLPYLTEFKDNNFAKFHANQSLVLLLFGIIFSVISFFLTFISFGILFFLPTIFGMVFVGFLIIGMINAYNGEMKKLPIIGETEILN